jgi:hypothetical protein
MKDEFSLIEKKEKKESSRKTPFLIYCRGR